MNEPVTGTVERDPHLGDDSIALVFLEKSSHNTRGAAATLHLHDPTRANGRAMKVIGPTMPVITDVDSYFSQGLAHVAVSRDGSVFYIARDAADGDGDLVWVDRSGKVAPVSSIVRPYASPRLSPDGRQVAVTVGWGPQSDLWLYDIGRDSWSRLTHGSRNLTPVWSPDGKQIVFSSNRNRGFNLFIIPGDGSAPARQITNVRTWPFPSSWSPDGSTIAIIDQYRDTLTDIFMLSVENLEARPVRQTKFDENEAVFSPDGHWIAYQSDESGRQEVYVQKYPEPGPKWLVSTNGGTLPRWKKDGRELFYRSGNGVFAVAVKLATDFESGRPRLLFRGEFDDYYDVSPDGQRFVMVRRTREASRTQINVVLGLFPARGRHAGTPP